MGSKILYSRHRSTMACTRTVSTRTSFGVRSIPYPPRQPFRRGVMQQLHILIFFYLHLHCCRTSQLTSVCNEVVVPSDLLNHTQPTRMATHAQLSDEGSTSAHTQQFFLFLPSKDRSHNWDYLKRFLLSQGRHTRSCSSWKTRSRRSWMGGKLRIPSTGLLFSNACTSPR